MLVACLCASCTMCAPMSDLPALLRRARRRKTRSTSRNSIPSAPCATGDNRCWNQLGLKHVNRLRTSRTRGRALQPLKMGTERMFDIAMKHSMRMHKKAARRRSRGKTVTYHQNPRRIDLGCNSWFSGENVAYVARKKAKDAAGLCLERFRKSPLHRNNLLSNVHRYVVLGVYVDSKGFVWCTQIFSTNTRFGGGKCKRA